MTYLDQVELCCKVTVAMPVVLLSGGRDDWTNDGAGAVGKTNDWTTEPACRSS